MDQTLLHILIYARVNNTPYTYISFDGIAFGARVAGPIFLWGLFEIRELLPPTRRVRLIGALNDTLGPALSSPKETAV